MIVDDLTTWDVLVIDDEPDNLGVVSHVLNFHGVKLRVADGGKKGLQMLHESAPSLVLLDIQMPEISGWDILKIIREDETLVHLPVIAVTGYVLIGDRERILAAGFDGYIPKPISPLGLINYLKTVLHTRPVNSEAVH